MAEQREEFQTAYFGQFLLRFSAFCRTLWHQLQNVDSFWMAYALWCRGSFLPVLHCLSSAMHLFSSCFMLSESFKQDVTWPLHCSIQMRRREVAFTLEHIKATCTTFLCCVVDLICVDMTSNSCKVTPAGKVDSQELHKSIVICFAGYSLPCTMHMS